tara:strand:- start:345 stop:887 length:543 start_codon:yes stop_codon:yes gene_type:complete
MSIAVFNSFSQPSVDVVTGTYSWGYITKKESYTYPDNSVDYFYTDEGMRILAITNQPNKTYTLRQLTAEWKGGVYSLEEIIEIETDVINPHPTIKIEGANNTVTTITTLASDWYRTPSTNIYRRTKNLTFDVWTSFTGEDFFTWQGSSSSVDSGNWTDTTTARAVDADAGAAITVTLSNP